MQCTPGSCGTVLGTSGSAPAGRSVDIWIIAKFIKPFIMSNFV